MKRLVTNALLTLFTVIAFGALAPRSAHALKQVDLEIGWAWEDGDFWDLCDPGVQSCYRVVNVSVRNRSLAFNTLAHLYWGDSDPNSACNDVPELIGVYRAADAAYQPSGSPLGLAAVTYTDYSGDTWNNPTRRVAQQPVNADRTIYLVFVHRITDDPDDVHCDMKWEVRGASDTTDPVPANNAMMFNAGACFDSGCDFSMWPL